MELAIELEQHLRKNQQLTSSDVTCLAATAENLRQSIITADANALARHQREYESQERMVKAIEHFTTVATGLRATLNDARPQRPILFTHVPGARPASAPARASSPASMTGHTPASSSTPTRAVPSTPAVASDSSAVAEQQKNQQHQNTQKQRHSLQNEEQRQKKKVKTRSRE